MQLRSNRRQFAVGAATAALAATLPAKARSVTPALQWHTDSKVEVGGHNPQGSGGPVVATLSDTLLTVYAGQGGKNLWYAYTGPSLTWQGNWQITDPKAGNAITTGGRPALCNVLGSGYFLMVVPGQRVFSTWKYTLSNWIQVGAPYEDITVLQFSEPAMGDDGGTTHLLMCDNNGNLWWYSMSHSGGSWSNQKRVASGKYPSITATLTSGTLTLHALYWDTDQKAFVKLTLPKGAPSWQSNRLITAKTPNQGAAIVSFKQQLYVVYTASGSGNNLQYAPLNTDYTLGMPMPVAPNAHAAATDAAPALVEFQVTSSTPAQDSLIMLHKGESSNNLWFSVAD